VTLEPDAYLDSTTSATQLAMQTHASPHVAITNDTRVTIATDGNPSVVKPEVGIRSGPLQGTAPFHSDFGGMR